MKAIRLKITVLLGSLILLFGGYVPLAVAQDNAQATDTTAARSLEARLADRKAQLKTRLTSAQTNRLKDRCKAAQGVLTALDARIKVVERNRINAYDKINDHLDNLVTRIGDQANTTELKTQITTFKDRVETFENNVSAYRQIINDLTVLDCVADPTAFKASLEAAKSLQSQLKTQAADIRTYLNETIKPTVTAIRGELSTKQGAVIN